MRLEPEVRLKWESVLKKAPPARWPSRFQRGLEKLEDGESRKKLKGAERDWERVNVAGLLSW
jgi:hypothetical protein